ncbi:insulinase family protein [Streptomyces sp. NPDC058486]|uniref:insulinase family protein n=1 Tax=unclassified Streptomyces TaxID=2593676 RepID=UPI00364C3147
MTAPTTPRRSAGTHRLDIHGLHVELEVLPWAHSFAAALAVGCGSRDDRPGREGTAHQAEHLHVVTRPTAPTGGIPLHAVTDIDRTLFQAEGDPDESGIYVDRLLDIVTGRHTPVTTDVFEGERHAVLLETRRMDHRPMLRLGPLLAAAAADEPGLDAIARTTTDSVRRVTPEHVTALVHQGYHPANSRLFLAGPPSAMPGVEAALARRNIPRPPAEPSPRDDSPPHPHILLKGLDDVTAVTLVRPRHTLAPDLASLVVLPRPPLGSTTIEGRAQRVDIAVWRGVDIAAALERRLAHAATAPRPAPTSQDRPAPRHPAHPTPFSLVGAAAAGSAFPAEPNGTRHLALWTVTAGIFTCLARHPLDQAEY